MQWQVFAMGNVYSVHCTHKSRLLRRFKETSAADNDGNSAKHNKIKEINNIKWLLFRWQNWYKLSYKLFAWLPICCDSTVQRQRVFRFGYTNRICSVYFSRKYDWLPWNGVYHTFSSRYFKYHYHMKTGLVEPFSSHVKWIDRIIIGITDAIIFIYSPISPPPTLCISVSIVLSTNVDKSNECKFLPNITNHIQTLWRWWFLFFHFVLFLWQPAQIVIDWAIFK